MGKDQELLDAARNGNITLIEKILSQRGKRSGPLASLRRGPGANIQDSAGYSALHYASLNGHTECVRLLLMHEASPNLPDSRGSSPLHLACWAGHQDIVNLLLTQSNRPANPNLQTIDNETPLHCAARHGHTGALTTLLAHGANPNMVNHQGEKPLDLACQFGRLQVVQMLIRAHPELLLPYKKSYDDDSGSDYGSQKILSHSPLHLASRNGHRQVVEVLLSAGIDVNLLTTNGTALHEAALCGKDSVVKALLEFGCDLDVRDSEGRTALDLLKQFPPHVTKGIVSVIKNYQHSMALSSQEDILKVSRRESYYDEQSYHSRGSRDNRAWNSYSNDGSGPLESPSSSAGSLDPASPRLRSMGDNNGSGNFYVTMVPLNNSSKVSPTPPKKPPRRNLSISPSTSKPIVSNRNNVSGDGSSSTTSPYEYLFLAQSGDKKMPISKAASMDQYVQMMSPAAQQKHEAVIKHLNETIMKAASSINDEELPATQLRSYNPNRKLRRMRDSYDFETNGSRNNHGKNHKDNPNDEPMSPSNYRQPPTPDHPPPSAMHAERIILERIRPLSQEYRRRSMAFEHMSRSSHNGTSTFGGYEYRNRTKSEKRQSVPQPLHPHHPPPQSKYPPPQFQSQFHPRYRNRSSSNARDSLSPCSSDLIMSHSLNASSGSLSSSMSERSASTDCVEEYIGDVPFAGLFKGSTMTLDNPNLMNYGNSQADYKYYQQLEQQHNYHYQQQHLPNKTYRSPAYDKRHHPQQSQPQPMQQQFTKLQSNRPERPKTLDTQANSVHPLKPISSISFTPQPSINNSQKNHSQAKIVSITPSSEDDARKIENKPTKTVKYSMSVDSADTKNNANSVQNSSLSPFDEQEEWKKISEIMANFGSDLIQDADAIQNDASNMNANRRRDNQTNGRSNSIAGFSFAELNRQNNSNENTHRHSMKYTESLSNTAKRRSGSQSPHGLLMNFLYTNELEALGSILYDNGYDDVDFIKGILEESDLETLEINEENRKKLMAAVDNDLQKPARAITAITKPASNAKSSVYHSISTNNEKMQQINSNNNDYASNSNNNNYSTIPKQKNQNNYDCSTGTLTVDEWLASIRLTQYSEVFKKHLYTDMERISRIWEIELQAVLEINKMGHRKRILYSVGAVPPKNDKILEKLTKNPDTPNRVSSSQRSSLSISSHESTNPDATNPVDQREHRPRHRKNRQAPQPPVQRPQPTTDDNVNKLAETTSNLEIRAPSELLLGFPNLRTQWRHSAEILITSHVKYEVNYLGSTVVKELRGTESTRKSIQKLKKTEQLLSIKENDVTTTALTNNGTNCNSAKRAVFILISYRGVQFVDPESQSTICEHEIRNINCACQDADDLSHFAYITKDSDNDTHYCHVFNVASMDLATEIILTLGQAFEVAYQIALKKSTPTTPLRSPTISSVDKQASQLQQ